MLEGFFELSGAKAMSWEGFTLEIRSTLPDELLMYGDKLSMAHGLEVRVPYLDKEIVEFAERLPATSKCVMAAKNGYIDASARSF